MRFFVQIDKKNWDEKYAIAAKRYDEKELARPVGSDAKILLTSEELQELSAKLREQEPAPPIPLKR